MPTPPGFSGSDSARRERSCSAHPTPAVAAIILRDREILMVRRGQEPGAGRWSIPGGSVELGETLEQALKREVREETGLEIEVGEFAGIAEVIVREGEAIKWHYVILDYFATPSSTSEPIAASDVTECRWIPLDELARYDVTETLIERLRELRLISDC
jgi:8-oxo-dGTP diphosphatase